MYNNQFERNERRIRTRAKIYTALLFGGLLATTVYFGNGGSFELPQNVKSGLGLEKKTEKDAARAVVITNKEKA